MILCILLRFTFTYTNVKKTINQRHKKTLYIYYNILLIISIVILIDRDVIYMPSHV